MNNNTTKVIVPCRFSYLHCWEPDSVNGGDPKYSVSAIIPKSDTKTINAIKAAIEQAKKDSVSKWGGKVPANLKLPLRDGDIDRPDDEAYAGSYFFNANSRQAPQVVDAKVQPTRTLRRTTQYAIWRKKKRRSIGKRRKTALYHGAEASCLATRLLQSENGCGGLRTITCIKNSICIRHTWQPSITLAPRLSKRRTRQ